MTNDPVLSLTRPHGVAPPMQPPLNLVQEYLLTFPAVPCSPMFFCWHSSEETFRNMAWSEGRYRIQCALVPPRSSPLLPLICPWNAPECTSALTGIHQFGQSAGYRCWCVVFRASVGRHTPQKTSYASEECRYRIRPNTWYLKMFWNHLIGPVKTIIWNLQVAMPPLSGIISPETLL